MTNKEINEAINCLIRNSSVLEEMFIENGGEVTEEASTLLEDQEAIKALLSTEGADSLGRWLVSKSNELAMYKAEKAAADARIKSVTKTIDYIKGQIAYLLKVTGQEKVKGTYYSFSQAVSVKNSVNQEAVNDAYLGKVLAVASAVLPDWITIELKTTATKVIEAGQKEFVNTTEEDSVRFGKPRKTEE